MPKGGVIKRSNVTKKMARISNLFVHFAKEIDPVSRRMLSPGGSLEKIGWEEPSDAVLLRLRQMLSWEVKQGMLERKDREMEIAIMAVLVWFARLEKERRDQVLQLWS